jgi:bisphosphoglycerate-independent phosphoglycerate mutase (AlkP superfamily)
VECLDAASELLVLVSDHGNIEEPDHRRHSMNPVPFCTFGWREREARENLRDLADVTPRIVEILSSAL